MQENIGKNRLSLLKPKESDEKEDGEDTSDNKDDTDKEDIEDIKLDLEKQRDELKNVATEIKDISEGLKEP